MATKTAIVFAGGGSLGAVQVGMLRALVEVNVRFDLVVGASVGAINGAYFAARPDLEGVEALAGFWRGLRKMDIFPLSWLDTCRGLIKGRGFLLQPAALNRLLGQALPRRHQRSGGSYRSELRPTTTAPRLDRLSPTYRQPDEHAPVGE